MIAPGALIEYYQDKKILCGLCLKADKKNLHLISEENREVGIPLGRVLLASAGFLRPDSLREDVVSSLRAESTRREEIRSGVSLADLWEVLCDEPGPFKPEELAGTWFGSAPEPDQVSGMLRALRDDRIYFERKSELFAPSSRERVSNHLEAIAAEQLKVAERAEITRWLQTVWNRRDGRPATDVPAPPCTPKYIEWLKDAALFGPESGRFKEIQTVLGQAGISQRDAPFQLLVRAGLWDPDENLALYRNRVPVDFPDTVLTAARHALDEAESEVWREATRVDLTHLHAVTIDDEYTVETDDALSIRRLDDAWEVGIHIADPAEFVLPESTLDREALHRGTSVYFPDLKIPMLPSTIGTQVCSLRQGVDRPALSVIAVLDEQGELLSTRIVESVVHVQERLTYAYVDTALEEHTDTGLENLYRLACRRRERRRAAGAVFIPFPSVEVFVHVGAEGERRIEIRREEQDIPSHVLVSEFMILANEAVASYCVEHQIPAVYRGQPPPAEPITLGEVFTALDGFKIRRLLRKGETSLAPLRHSGLGVDAYLQFTSPIRRYLDLVMHRQVKSHLREGRPMYVREDLERISAITSSSSEQAESMERSRKSYWIYKHLDDSLWQTRFATVLQVFPDRYHVQLHDTLVETDCPAVPGAGVVPGDAIEVKIELVWAREGVLRVSPMLERKSAARMR